MEATKRDLELAIAAAWRDLNESVTDPRFQDDSDEWGNGYREGVKQSRDLVGIILRTYAIPESEMI